MEEKMLVMISKQLSELIALIKKQTKQQGQKVGRPTKEHVVAQYRANYPDKRKVDCVQETGLSFKTVNKYWKMALEKESP